MPSNKESTVETDNFGRPTKRTLNTASSLEETYEYEDNDGNTTPLVSVLTLKKGGAQQENLQYKYDENKNIKQIRNANNELLAGYEYDGLNRLVMQSIPSDNEIIVYSYDAGGNIQTKKIFAYSQYSGYTAAQLKGLSAGSTKLYSYITSGNRDRLLSYNGSADEIKYDYSGNPDKWFKHGSGSSSLKYKLFWTHGSDLGGIVDEESNNAYAYAYAYNDEGIRIYKSANGTEHKYYVDGSRIIAEIRTTKDTTNRLIYYYDATGVCGFNYNGSEYYYQKNLQGDVVKVYNVNGSLVAEYRYDAWGKCKIITNSNGIAEINPYRYRSYYYDNETGLYYLNSRYYDPEVGRFLSADTVDYLDPESINGLNLYAYCLNNPVMYYDPSGHFVITATLLAWFAVALFGLATISVIETTFHPIETMLYGFQDLVVNIADGIGGLFESIGSIGNNVLFAEHRQKTPSKRNKHEKGQAQRKKEKYGGEKRDSRRTKMDEIINHRNRQNIESQNFLLIRQHRVLLKRNKSEVCKMIAYI